MKYRRLPIEDELEQIRKNAGEEAMEVRRNELVVDLLRSPGFQILVLLLRDIERIALNVLRSGKGTDSAAAAQRIKTIEYIRQCVLGIVPGATVDWADEELEEFLPPDIVEI